MLIKNFLFLVAKTTPEVGCHGQSVTKLVCLSQHISKSDYIIMTSYQKSLGAMYDDVYLDILNVITSIKTLRNQSLATIGHYGLVFVYFLTNFKPSLSGSPAALQEGVLAWV